MKKKVIIINVLLSMAVLFSILFQAIHSYEHHYEQLTKEYSHHHSENKTEINQGHHIYEKCMVCDFNFSSFTTTDFYAFPFYGNNTVAHYPKFYFQKFSSFFKGSLFSLRAPPLF